MEALTTEEARTVELSHNPIKRLGQLAEYGSAYGLKKVGLSPMPLFMTRGDLVKAAETREKIVASLSTLQEIVQGEIEVRGSLNG
jgi:hypothetical protein